MPRAPTRPSSTIRGLTVLRGPRPGDRRVWYWRLRRTVDGEVHTLWTGWATADEAEHEAHRVLAGPLLRREDEPGDRAPETVRVLLRFWGREQQARATIRPRTQAAYRGAVRRLSAVLGDVHLDLLSQATLERYRDSGGAPATVKLDLQVLGGAWKWGRERGWTRGDLPRVELRRHRVRDHHTPTDGDVAAVLRHLDGWPALAVRLLHATGARLGEVATLTWNQVDLDRGWVKVDEKTGPRRVPIDHLTGLLAELRGRAELPRQVDYVLGVRPGTPRRLLYVHLAKAYEVAGVQRFSAHGLRRLASTTLLEAGVSPLTYEALMGHSYRVAKEDYATARDAALQEAASLLGRLPSGDLVDGPWRASGGDEDGA